MRLLPVTVLMVFSLLAAACNSGPQDQPPPPPDSREAKTQPAATHAGDPHWSYEGAEGPAAWGTLSPAWAVCGNGTRQSPIDIDATVNAELPGLRATFTPAALKIIHHEHMADAVNSGHSIQVNYTEGDTLAVGNEQFALLQYHFHGPSEHTVAGKHYPMEMHMVHKSASGKLAVIGVLIEEGQHNAAFDPVWSHLPTRKGEEVHLEHVMVDVDRLLPDRRTTYRYDGSLTTPPCSEGVNWIVMTTPIQLSAKQLARFRAVMEGNNRPVQALNGRTIVTDTLAENRTR